MESHWHVLLEELVVTSYRLGVPCKHIEVVEASHPVPDEAESKVARKILGKVSGLTADDLVLVLISGSGSALLALRADGITLADKKAANRALLKCDADLDEISTVRKQLSATKADLLTVPAAPARVVAFAISDEPGGDLSVGSGPTVPDVSTRADALAALTKYRIEIPASAAMHLENDASETPKLGDPRFANVTNSLVGTAQKSLEAAAKVVRGAGLPCMILGNAIEGEARGVGIVHASVARQCGDWGQPLEIPCGLISGGERTVTIRGSGRGGRNTEFLLSPGIAADGRIGIWALAADTDGIDGSEGNAGAILTPHTLQPARASGIDAKASLADNDPHRVFAALDDLVVPVRRSPTSTISESC